ncbi:TnsA-like heteromeric transposase endonuclease subunit [Streptomyces sp. YH02]|uniref:TnsA-like heteromeric transposase endonuclease subunit n=1 Tax=Streptomyces sp. YH02 TaxID=3256999 RepID=UPI00375828DD
MSVDLLRSAIPWRSFRWHMGQKHYSGSYWSATTRDHVVYESRLELSRLLFADFDPLVRFIAAQPFLIQAVVKGEPRRHVPDYLLVTDEGPVVVDVKPRERLTNPKVAFTFDWTKRTVQSRGWQYEVWSEPPTARLENLRFLSGYRRDWLFDSALLAELRLANFDGLTLGDAARITRHRPEPCVRAAIHHLMWAGELSADLARPLSPATLLRQAT